MIGSRLIAAVAVSILTGACAPPPSSGPVAAPVAGASSISSDSVPGIPGFSSAVKRGLTLYLSGQAPLDMKAQLVAPNDLAGQVRQSLRNLSQLVRTARGLPGDVVQLTFYVVDLQPADGAVIQSAAREIFADGVPPAVTIVGVSSLGQPRMRVMVDGVAVLRSEFLDRERLRGGAAR